MPSTMIHLMTAYLVEPQASGLFFTANFAPDYTNDRAFKSKIHLRDSTDRWDALNKLYEEINSENDFERGWFLHLFTDACWDSKQLVDYKNWYESTNSDEGWFGNYRNEIGCATYYLYHNMIWSKEVWDKIKQARIGSINPSLLAEPEHIEGYRDRVAMRHAESDPANMPKFYTPDTINAFARATANRYISWVSARNYSNIPNISSGNS